MVAQADHPSTPEAEEDSKLKSSLSYTERPISKKKKNNPKHKMGSTTGVSSLAMHRTFAKLLQGQPGTSNFPVPENSGFHLDVWVSMHKLDAIIGLCNTQKQHTGVGHTGSGLTSGPRAA